MMSRTLQRLLAPLALALPFAATFATPQLADAASLSACGNIHVEASAECSVEVEGGCVAQCEPIRFQGACAAELYVDCEGTCQPLEIEAGCEGSCMADCSAECDVDPGNFKCEGSCSASCEASCEADCEASAGNGEARAECNASCTASCDAECSGSCEGTPPSADCDAKCSASCEGQCYAEVRGGCHVDCAAEGYATCYGELQGGCEVACESPEGALFCDGQYIDHGNNLDECVAALGALFNIMVEGYAEAECSNGTCEAEAGGSISCSVTDARDHHRGGALALILGLGLLRTRRRR